MKATNKPSKTKIADGTLYFTGMDFDRALMEQTREAQSMNIPRNAICSSVTFSELIGRKIFGKREDSERAGGVVELVRKVIADASAERAMYQRMADAEADRQKAAQQQQRIVIPRN